VLAVLDARLYTAQRVETACEVPPCAGVLRMLVPGIAVGEIIDRRSMADG